MTEMTNTVQDRASDAEWKLRCELAAAFRLAAHYGWDDLIFTHMSVRVPGPEHHFLINPYNLMFEEVTASSLIKIGLDGKPVEQTPYLANPAGFTIHSALHAAREDANCVIHLHTTAGQAVSAMAEGLMPLTQTAMLVRWDTAYHEYEGVATDLAERERLVEHMGEKHVLILRNHGTLTVGRSVGDAFLRMYLLERACAAQVMALSAGPQGLYTPPQGAPEKVAGQATGDNVAMLAQFLAWPALVRKLDRMDPSYRD